MGKLGDISSAMPTAGPQGASLADAIRTAVDHIPGLVWTSLPDGYIDFLNLRWREFTGLSLEQCCGWGWQVAIHSDDLPGSLQTWAGVLACAPARAQNVAGSGRVLTGRHSRAVNSASAA